ncbi:uncharacterized protein METZ01_LOCUS311479, partial [marine metagenome]
ENKVGDSVNFIDSNSDPDNYKPNISKLRNIGGKLIGIHEFK